MEDKLKGLKAKDIRIVPRAYVGNGGSVVTAADEGSRTLVSVWQTAPPCTYVVAEFDGTFYVIALDTLMVDENAYLRPYRYTCHDDLDAAVMAAVLSGASINTDLRHTLGRVY